MRAMIDRFFLYSLLALTAGVFILFIPYLGISLYMIFFPPTAS